MILLNNCFSYTFFIRYMDEKEASMATAITMGLLPAENHLFP